MNKSAILALSAAAVLSIAIAAPASAQNRLKTCNDEWNAMKANNTVGDKKYADFRKECLARTAAAPAGEPAAAPSAAPPPAAAPAPRSAARAAKPAAPAAPAPSSTPAAAGAAVFPTAVSDKYSSESPGRGRMHTCRDQYQENKTSNANGGLNWIQKGGGYYSECNKHLKGEG